MREIKFRAWDTERNKMVEPFELGSVSAGDGYGINWIPTQFTGLHDKNGKEIYEGDVIQCLASEGSVVAAVVFEPAHGYGLRDAKGDWQGYLGRKDRPTVIGNIYENPELIK